MIEIIIIIKLVNTIRKTDVPYKQPWLLLGFITGYDSE